MTPSSRTPDPLRFAWSRLLLQLLCSHTHTAYSSGYDWSETVCLRCGLRHGVEGRDFGRDWRKQRSNA